MTVVRPWGLILPQDLKEALLNAASARRGEKTVLSPPPERGSSTGVASMRCAWHRGGFCAPVQRWPIQPVDE